MTRMMQAIDAPLEGVEEPDLEAEVAAAAVAPPSAPRRAPPRQAAQADVGRLEDLEGLEDSDEGEATDDDGVVVDADKITEILDFEAVEGAIEEDVRIFINADITSLVGSDI